MRFVDFERGHKYSRDGYEFGLVIAYSEQRQHWAYYKHGKYGRPITTGSNAHRHRNFYRSNSEGGEKIASLREKVRSLRARRMSPTQQQELDRAMRNMNGRVVMTGTPQGTSLWDDVYNKSNLAKEHDELRIKLAENGPLDKPRSYQLGDYVEYKEEKMPRLENDGLNTVAGNVQQETVDVALINIGEIIYNMGGSVVERFAPKLTWYEKVFTSKEKRELAMLVGTYVAMQAVKLKYRHYLIDAVSAYLNFELQRKLLGGLSQETLDKLFAKFEKTA